MATKPTKAVRTVKLDEDLVPLLEAYQAVVGTRTLAGTLNQFLNAYLPIAIAKEKEINEQRIKSLLGHSLDKGVKQLDQEPVVPITSVESKEEVAIVTDSPVRSENGSSDLSKRKREAKKAFADLT